ncbi:hypothetical protein, partial [Escherichia coli]|uniref:hypothetical protein n=1 Tax=Escherichia coli TaxID=562 RepID=UPI0013D3A646
FIATEAFGRRALFCLDAHAATVTAETDVLVYELTQASLARLFADSPDLIPVMAQALAQVNWRPIGGAQAEADAIALQRRVNLYRGQIEASYG